MKNYSKIFIISLLAIVGVLALQSQLFASDSKSAAQDFDFPVILKAFVSPEKVRPQDLMTITVNSQSKTEIQKVTARIFHESGSDTIELSLVEGSAFSGLWQGKWLVHDTKEKDYPAIVTVTNASGKSATKEIIWSDPDLIFGSEYVFNSATTTYNSVASLSATTFVVTYTDGGNSSYGTAIIGTVSGTTISYGSEYVFNSANTTYNSVASLSATTFVVTYTDGGGASYYGTAIIGTVSGSTISFGSEYVFNSAVTDFISVASFSSTSFVVSYADTGNSNYGTAIIGTVSGSAISYGSEYVFNSATSSYTSVASLSSTSFVVGYQDGGNSSYGTAIIGTVSGTTISYGSEYVFNSANTSLTTHEGVDSLSSTSFVIAYGNLGVTPYNGVAIIGTVSGTTISYGSAYVFNPASSSYASVASLSSTSFVVTYSDGGNSWYNTAIIGTISGTTIGYGSEYVFNSAADIWISNASLSSTSFVVGYEDAGNSNYGTAIIGQLTPFDDLHLGGD